MKVILLILCLSLANADNILEVKDASEIIESRGLQSKSYTTTTSDGYIIKMYRIINPTWKSATKAPVLLQHGLMANGNYWLLNTEGHIDSAGKYTEDGGVVTDCAANATAVGNSIPFVLAACGYDVWLGNNRGTRYSTGHTKYNSLKDSEYWNYNIDSLTNDIIAEINFIKTETKSDHVAYIGHSLGTTQMFQLLSESPEMNKVVKPFIALAPVAYLAHMETLEKAASTLEPLFEVINSPFLLLPSQELKYGGNLISDVCKLPIAETLCESFVFLITGFDYKNNDESKYPERLGLTADESSFKVGAHLAHRVNSGTFGKFDYKLTNLVHYGSLTPPKYDLTKITSPNIVLMSSNNDPLADQKDIDMFRKEVKVKIAEDYVVPDKDFNHLDFVWAENTGKLINPQILQALAKYA